jgi:hypothetical protein
MFFTIIKYLPVNERSKLSVLNKECNIFWNSYSKKYSYIVIKYEVENADPINICDHAILADTTNYLEALKIYDKQCKEYKRHGEVPNIHDFYKNYYKRTFIHSNVYMNTSEMYLYNFIVTMFVSDRN